MIEIIGIYSEGYGSGKDSIATTLTFDFDYVIFGFSEIMKEHLYLDLTHVKFPTLNMWLEYCETHKYDKTGDEGFWVRALLKGYGQFYRSINPNYWVENWEAQVANYGYTKVSVPNVRFPNEAARIRELGGSLIKVIRPGIIVDNDPSETSMSSWVPDYVIMNDKGLDELREKVHQFMKGSNLICPNQLVKEKSIVS